MASTARTVISKTVVSAIDGIKIYAEAIGEPSKPPLIYIHGNSSSSGVWDYQFFDEQLLKHFYHIRFDLRGHGLSETPRAEAEGPFDNEKQASDVAAVLKEFSINKPIFVSWSYGALIPADYMSVHGYEGVRGVVVVDGLIGPMPEVKDFFQGGPFPGFTDNGDATQMHHAYGLFVRALTFKPLSREWTLRIRGMLTETDTSTRSWIFKRKKDLSVYMGPATKAIPKLVVFGKEDALNSLKFVDYIKTKWDPSLLTAKFIDDAGHASYLEKPTEFNAILLEWAKNVVKT